MHPLVQRLAPAAFALLLVVAGGGRNKDAAFEAAQTEKLLGVSVQDFPPPQGPTGFDELPGGRPAFDFTVAQRPLSGPKPREYYKRRPRVEARAPDGSTYEACCRWDEASTTASRRLRHCYGGTYFFPKDVYIAKKGGQTPKPLLCFPDVGSHDTAPHHLAFDDRGRCHLAVADVVIFEENRLHLYWVVGDPAKGRWEEAWMVDRRGFTSSSQPWMASHKESVHLIWSWYDAREGRATAASGLFHVERARKGFGRKGRIVDGEVDRWDVATDPGSGRLLLVFGKEDGVYAMSRPADGKWTRAVRVHPTLDKGQDVSVVASEAGSFVVRTGVEDTKEWVLRPR
jgi:hypothetical protein